MKYLIQIIILFMPLVSLANELDAASHLRTLFTSPQVRSQLDNQRASGKFAKSNNNDSTPVLREPVKVKMQGVVLREHKKPVIFVNNSNTLKSRRVDDNIIVNDKRVKTNSLKVPVRVNQQPINLKPGQQWNESDRRAQDNYQIKPAKQKPKGMAAQAISEIME